MRFGILESVIMLDVDELDEHTLLTMFFDCNAHIAK